MNERQVMSMVKKVEDGLDAKFQTYTYVATGTVSVIPHPLPYDPLHDNLQVFQSGLLLKKPDNYTETSTNITLVGWTIPSGDTVDFMLYKGVK